MLKRISSLVLCLALLLSGWPVGAAAEEAQPATPAEAAGEPCAHVQAAESTWEEISYWPIGDEQHSITTYAHERVECPDCGAVLKDDTHIVGDAYAEAHAYNDEGVCPLCAHTAPAMDIMPLSLDITEEDTTRAMSLSVDDIIVGQAFSFSWSEVPSAHHYEVAVTRIDLNDQEHKLLGDASIDNRQDVGTSLSFTVSAADVASDTKRMRVYVGAAPDTSFPTPWEGMIKEASAMIDVRYEVAKEMDVQVSVSGDTATVEWAEVVGADHYLYKVLDVTDGNAEVYQETQTQALSFELPGLVTGHEYKIWVASYDAGGALISQHASQSKLLLECHHEQTEDVESAELFGDLTEITHTRYARFDVVCKACGEVISADQIKTVGQEEHAFTGNVCDACGYDKADKNAVLALSVGEAISGKPLAVSWNAIDGVDHYQVDVKDLTTDASLFGGMQTTAETSLTVDGAKVAADHEYKIWAAAFSADGIMLTQATQTVTAEQIKVELTLNVGPAVGGQTLIVTWNEVEGVDHYQYNIRNLSTDTPIWGETGESTQIPSLMLNGILVDDNVEYKIWVGAFDASGSMMGQTTQTVKTTAAQSNPMNLSYSGTPLADVDLQMSWSKLSDADHYEYSMRDVTANTSVYSRVETGAAYFTIPGTKLEANHSYRFWVGAIGADGAEPDGNHQGSVSFTVVQCPHGSATPKNEVATRTSISDTQHHVIKTYDLYCTYCDTMIEEGKKEEYDENHNLDEAGDCTLCDYRKECKHENQVKEYVDTTYTALEDGEHHRATDIYSLVCADCGKVIVQLDSSLNEVREEEHSFTEDVCALCGYTKAEQLGVTIKLDQQTAKCGEMIGADAVVVGGSGSYRYGWEIYRDGVKVKSNSDYGDRCTYTAAGAGQWKFMVRVTDTADDEAFWAESATVEVKHDVTSEEIADKRKIERNDQKTHAVVKTMHVICACGEVDKTEEVREQVEHTKGSASNKTEHPHRKYFVCTVCGQEIDGGEDGYDAGCATCNPPKTENTGNTENPGNAGNAGNTGNTGNTGNSGNQSSQETPDNTVICQHGGDRLNPREVTVGPEYTNINDEHIHSVFTQTYTEYECSLCGETLKANFTTSTQKEAHDFDISSGVCNECYYVLAVKLDRPFKLAVDSEYSDDNGILNKYRDEYNLDRIEGKTYFIGIGEEYTIRIEDILNKKQLSSMDVEGISIELIDNEGIAHLQGDTVKAERNGLITIVLKYNGEEIDRLNLCTTVLSVKDKLFDYDINATNAVRLDDMDNVDWSDCNVAVSSNVVIENYTMTEQNDKYHIRFDAYNSSSEVIGIGIYDEKGELIDVKMVEPFWGTGSYVETGRRTILATIRTFDGKYGNQRDSQKTSISIELEKGGHIEFLEMKDNENVLVANIAEGILGSMKLYNEIEGAVNIASVNELESIVKSVGREKYYKIVEYCINNIITEKELTKITREEFFKAVGDNGVILIDEVINQIPLALAEMGVDKIEDGVTAFEPFTYYLKKGTGALTATAGITQLDRAFDRMFDNRSGMYIKYVVAPQPSKM